MHTRQNELDKWLGQLLNQAPFSLIPLAGDASFRRYFRLHYDNTTCVVMDAPPEKEEITPFITIAQLLLSIGIHTPAVHTVEKTQGFILLEDLGDELLLGKLSPKNADSLYKAAMIPLLKMQQCPLNTSSLPIFDTQHMLQELSLFREWFLDAYLGLQLNNDEETLIIDTFNWLIEQINKQPHVFIHRDYHSRNLLLLGEHLPYEIGVIDFQDAMRGPFAYDLVSLLKDCYVQWPREQVIQWVTYFYEQLPNSYGWSLQQFMHAFDLCGLQRHLKVLGIFSRLHLRDNKPSYLKDLPLIFNYVTACAESYKELQPFYRFMQEKIYLPFKEKNSQERI